VDHAGALGDAGNGEVLAVQRHLARGRLGDNVGGHDRFRRRRPVGRLEVGNGGRQGGHDLVVRQRLQDHAGGKG